VNPVVSAPVGAVAFEAKKPAGEYASAEVTM
jgi:hypothetical protein